MTANLIKPSQRVTSFEARMSSSDKSQYQYLSLYILKNGKLVERVEEYDRCVSYRLDIVLPEAYAAKF